MDMNDFSAEMHRKAKLLTEWQPMATYDGSIVKLSNGSRVIVGHQDDDEWVELVDGQAIAVEGFIPILWMAIPDEALADFC